MARSKTSKPPRHLNEYLRYNPHTGNFHWIITTHGRGGMIYPGDVAGSLKDGYIVIHLDGVVYRAHRLAWYVMTGEWLPPEQDLDHRNGERSDNRFHNLRKATRSENNDNPNNKLRSDNVSGTRGVSWRADTNKWHARIKIKGKIILLGDYIELEDAVAARKAAEAHYH